MRYVAFLLTVTLLYSCQSGTNTNPGKSTADSSAPNEPAAKKETGFFLLKGTIDKYPVTMYLYARKEKYSGYYYYDSKEQPIYFYGDDTTNRGRITLNVYEQDSAETFVLDFDGKNSSGTWTYSGKTLPVKLSEADMPVKLSCHYWEDSVKLIDTLAASPQATAQLSSIWPEGSSATDECLKTQIAELLLPKTKLRNIDSVFHQSGKEFFTDYKSGDDLRIDLKEIAENPSSYSYDLEDDICLCYQNHNLLALAYSNYTYTGGAHGNYGTTYVSLDIANNKVITLSHVLTPEGIRHLQSLLENSYRKEKNLTLSQPLTDGGLFENKIEPNKNFYVTRKQLVFSYVPYEISSYADGQIDIAIDMSELQSYLQPSFKSLLQ